MPAAVNNVNNNNKNKYKLNSTAVSQFSQTNVVNSPQLSQISFGAHDESDLLDDDAAAMGGPVNRRLFGTPKTAGGQRGASTPFTSKNARMPPIQEVIGLDEALATANNDNAMPDAAMQLQDIGRNKRRRLEKDLFGDIDDLYHNESYEDPMVKKARTEEQRDMQDIEKILESRRKLREASKSLRKDNVTRLQALHDFKMRNLSYNLPQWPFLPLRRVSDGQKVYVRFHSQEYESKQLEHVTALPSYGGLLGDNKERIWAEAQEIVSSFRS